MSEFIDLTGVKCPLNWAKAKARLESMTRGDSLAILLDDPKGAADIPRAAEAEGWHVVETAALAGAWRIVILV